jgi:2-keto-4-pentenoate hydratase/2-oxohepta-3-ene-1,7-dioic acid hydratase in catechol pathway
MRTANVNGRLKLVAGDVACDVANASNGRFSPDPAAIYERWDDFSAWAREKEVDDLARERFDPTHAAAPSPSPRQVFAVALNYVDHAAESGLRPPEDPLFFTKYVSAFAGAHTAVLLPPGGNVDWECELVAVIARESHRIDPERAWSNVAGVTIGQDISERNLQRSGPVPQFSLGKSYPGFAPQGPVLVTPDELPNRDDLAIGCDVNGAPMQKARTSDMIFSVAELVAYLSRVLTLYPGDVIFTGTPPGVGMGRNPQVFLKPGDRLRSYIEGIGEMVQEFR